MKRLKVVQDPHEILRKRAIPVPLPLSKEDTDLLKDLLNYVHLSQDKAYAEKYKIQRSFKLCSSFPR